MAWTLKEGVWRHWNAGDLEGGSWDGIGMVGILKKGVWRRWNGGDLDGGSRDGFGMVGLVLLLAL